MDFLIASDIHGSYKYALMLFEKVEKIKPDQIFLLGDLYYNGARNDPPEDYSPKKVVSLLNSYADKIIALKGNCESDVDLKVSEFPISDLIQIYAFNKKITLTHGHIYSYDNHQKNVGDIFIQGHTHISLIVKTDSTIFANPGSISLPKDSFHSYMILNEEGIKILNLFDDSVIKSINF